MFTRKKEQKVTKDKITNKRNAQSASDLEFESKRADPSYVEVLRAGDIIYAISIFVLMIYMVGLVIFTFEVPPGTIVNSIDVSWQKYADLKTIVENVNPNDVFLIIEDKGSEIIRVTYSEVDGKKEAEVDVKFNKYLWFIDLFRAHNVNTNITYLYDSSKLRRKLKELNEDLEAPTAPKFEKVDGIYSATAGTPGSRVDVDKVLKMVDNAEFVGDILYLDTDSNPELLQQPPSIDNSVIKEDVEFYTEITKHLPQIQISDDILFSIGEAELCRLVEFNFDKKSLNVNLNEVESHIDDLYDKYYSVGTEQKFVDGEGQIRTVTGGTYGWELDKEETLKTFIHTLENLSEDEQPIIKVSWKSTGYTDGTNLLSEFDGDRYIVVSIEDQHVWVRDSGEIIMESDCVTGEKGKCDTPKGTFSVLERRDGKYLEGANYRTWVNKWMRLTWSGIGLHDATWRRNFGDKIFETNGSHGCINLPSQFASELFEWVKSGDVVFIY